MTLMLGFGGCRLLTSWGSLPRRSSSILFSMTLPLCGLSQANHNSVTYCTLVTRSQQDHNALLGTLGLEDALRTRHAPRARQTQLLELSDVMGAPSVVVAVTLISSPHLLHAAAAAVGWQRRRPNSGRNTAAKHCAPQHNKKVGNCLAAACACTKTCKGMH